MFEQMLLPTGGTHQTRNAALAFAGQIVLVAVGVLIIPAIFVTQLPRLELATELIAPPLPPPPPPRPAAATRAPAHPEVARVVPKAFVLPQVVAPTPALPQAALDTDAPPSLPDSGGVAGGIPGGVLGGLDGGSLGGQLGGAIGAPPPPKVEASPAAGQAPAAPSQIRVGGDVQAARLTHEVAPAYPPIARQARVTGTVELSATIAANGTVKDVHVMSGNPLLVQAAVSAVKQWTYKPTYLNGKPVEVLTEVDVKFSLG
jgi:periplasmic protein TonB